MAILRSPALPAQAAAAADVVATLGTFEIQDSQGVGISRIVVTPPAGYATVTGAATNNARIFVRQLRGGNALGTIPAPGGFTATAVASGGTFAAATYYWKVTATNALGETVGSVEASAAIAANGSADLAWNAVAGANGYKVYRATAAGGENTSPALVTTITSGSTVTYTDTGTATTAGTVPAVNLTGALASLVLGAGVNLAAETPVSVPVVAQTPTVSADDVLDVVLRQNGTGLAIGAGLFVVVDVT